MPNGACVRTDIQHVEVLREHLGKPKLEIGDTFTVFEPQLGRLITYTVEKAAAQFARDSLESLIPETSANKLAKIDVFTLEDCAGCEEHVIRNIVGNKVFEQIQNAMGILNLSFMTFIDGGGT